MPQYQYPWHVPAHGPGYGGLLEDRFRRLLTGSMKLYDLPEYKAMEHTLGRRGRLAREGAAKQMRAGGIRGPAMATTLRKMEEGQYAPIGHAMQATYGQLPGMAMDWQRHMDALAQAQAMRALQHYLGEEGLKTKKDIAEMQFIMQLLGTFI